MRTEVEDGGCWEAEASPALIPRYADDFNN